MTSQAFQAHLPALGEHVRHEVGRELQATLVDLVDLSLVGKQLHWTVVGVNFRAVHLHIDELVDSWRDLSDTVAERAVMLGVAPDGQAAAVAAASGFPALDAAPMDDVSVIRELTRRVADVAERIRVRTDRLGELDVASQDVLIEVLRAVEENLWMLRAQLG